MTDPLSLGPLARHPWLALAAATAYGALAYAGVVKLTTGGNPHAAAPFLVIIEFLVSIEGFMLSRRKGAGSNERIAWGAAGAGVAMTALGQIPVFAGMYLCLGVSRAISDAIVVTALALDARVGLCHRYIFARRFLEARPRVPREGQ